MISKAEPCLVISIQNQLTLCIGTVIVRQISVSQKLKLLFGYCADARNKIAESLKTKLCCTCIVNFVIIMNSLKFWHGLYGVAGFNAKNNDNNKN